MSMINHELSPDQPYLYIPNGLFIGRGTTQDGVHYEGFLMNDGHIHYFNTTDGKELPNDDNRLCGTCHNF